MRQDIRPGMSHREGTYFTHPFIVRDSETHQLKSFSYMSMSSVVFEGLEFGVSPNIEVEVGICEVKTSRSELGLLCWTADFCFHSTLPPVLFTYSCKNEIPDGP